MADRISKSVRKSSGAVYDHKWKVFCDWYKEKKYGRPEKAPRERVAEFMDFLFDDRKLEVRTIEGYRAAISGVLGFSNNSDLGSDRYLAALFANYRIERPVKENNFPKWDLGVVLRDLMEPPYEPINNTQEVPLLLISRKTAFLLLLASGARRGEVHALDYTETVSCEDGSLILKPHDGFMAKNFNPSTGKGRFEGFKITPLSHSVGRDLRKDRSLCPVRMYHKYLNRTKKIRGNIKQLFVAVPKNNEIGRKAHVNTISSWIKHTVSDAYKRAPDKPASSLHRSTHEIRAISSSICLYNNVAMESIMKQCRWANQTTFTSHYFRKLAQKDGLNLLPPALVAGTPVVPGQERSAH